MNNNQRLKIKINKHITRIKMYQSLVHVLDKLDVTKGDDHATFNIWIRNLSRKLLELENKEERRVYDTEYGLI